MEDRDVQSWLTASRYDLRTGAALLESRRYLYVLFMCQQSLEKLLKARITAETGALAPRIHNLLRLAGLARADLTQKEKAILWRKTRRQFGRKK
jgi:HEPN domain-containing protein